MQPHVSGVRSLSGRRRDVRIFSPRRTTGSQPARKVRSEEAPRESKNGRQSVEESDNDCTAVPPAFSSTPEEYSASAVEQVSLLAPRSVRQKVTLFTMCSSARLRLDEFFSRLVSRFKLPPLNLLLRGKGRRRKKGRGSTCFPSSCHGVVEYKARRMYVARGS